MRKCQGKKKLKRAHISWFWAQEYSLPPLPSLSHRLQVQSCHLP
jgi:hypothetical protein